MSFPPRALAVLALLVSTPLLIAGAAMAQSNERCSGTLCDLYYGGSAANEPQPAAKPAAPTPLMVPSGGILGFFKSGSSAPTAPSDANGTPSSSVTPHVRVGGGGLLGMARGETPERCTGTICDVYYGGPPPETPAAAATPAQRTTADAASAATPDSAAEEPRTSNRRSRVVFVERREKPGCAPTPQDPWRCYRK